VTGKPAVEELGIDVDAQDWQRSGEGDGAIEIAFVGIPAPPGGRRPAPARREQRPAEGGEWVLMRVAGDPAGRVLVYDRHEWDCFLDGVKKGEFDEAPGRPGRRA
jgi:hypothetical protein